MKIGNRKGGLSDLVATVLLVAMTLIAGAALFGYVNGQAANSENQLGKGNANNVNFLNERFVIVDLNFSLGNPSTAVSIWIYNNGAVTLNVTQVELYNASRTIDVFYQHNPPSLGCTLQSLPSYKQPNPFSNPLKLTLFLPCGYHFETGRTYYANVLGVYGNKVVYSACDSTSGCTS